MSLLKFRYIAPIMFCLGLAGWWLMPGYDANDKAYYVSVFCAVRHYDSQQYPVLMEKVIGDGNNGYALHKISYQPALGNKVMDAWQKMNPDEQQQLLTASDKACRQQLVERL